MCSALDFECVEPLPDGDPCTFYVECESQFCDDMGECAPDPTGCVARFEDLEFVGSGRDAVYYVRALEAPTPAVNGANLRTRFDAQGNAVAVEPCYGDARTPRDDDCLAPVQERAWSSPIFVDQPAQPPGA